MLLCLMIKRVYEMAASAVSTLPPPLPDHRLNFARENDAHCCYDGEASFGWNCCNSLPHRLLPTSHVD